MPVDDNDLSATNVTKASASMSTIKVFRFQPYNNNQTIATEVIKSTGSLLFPSRAHQYLFVLI